MIYDKDKRKGSKALKIREEFENKYKIFMERGASIHDDIKVFLSFCLSYITVLEQSTNENVRMIGELLWCVKERLKHGEFMRWISDNCPFSPRAGLNFMKLYRITLDHPELLVLKKSVIYLIASKSFTKELRAWMAEIGVGCYHLHYKEVLILKTKLDNREITIDDVELDKFFKKRRDIDLEARIKSENERIINAIEKQKTGYQSFVKQQKKEIGSMQKNSAYATHCKHVVQVLESATNSLQIGYKCQGKSTVTDKQSVLPSVSVSSAYSESHVVNSHSKSKTTPSANPSPFKSSFCISSRIRHEKIIQELGLAPWDINQGEESIPDDTLVRSMSPELSEFSADCYQKGIYKEFINRRLSIFLGPDDILVPEPGSDAYYADILCSADFTKNEREGIHE